MRLSDKTLLIVANPFAAPLSAEGRATALCPADPAEGGGRYVGASTRATVRKQPPGMRSPFGTRDKVSVVYALAPVRAADTSHHRGLLKSGDALPADGAADDRTEHGADDGDRDQRAGDGVAERHPLHHQRCQKHPSEKLFHLYDVLLLDHMEDQILPKVFGQQLTVYRITALGIEVLAFYREDSFHST